MRAKGGSRFTIIALAAALAALVLLFVLVRGRQQSFPALREGSYAGQISGLRGSADEFTALYIERPPNTTSLLIVAFVDDFKPQAVRLYRQLKDGEQSGGFDPVKFEYQDRQFLLSGAFSGNGASGDVWNKSGSRIGRWNASAAAIGPPPGGP